MFRRSLHSTIAAVIAFSLSASALAADWRDGPRSRTFSGPPEVAASTYLREFQDSLPIGNARLALSTVLHVGDGHTVRFVQSYASLPVFDAGAAVLVRHDGSIGTASFNISPELTVSPKPRLTEAEAVARAEEFGGRSFAVLASAQLGVLPNDEGGRLVYQIDAPGPSGGQRFRIDANTGDLAAQVELGKSVKGRVYKISSVNTPTPSDEDLLDLDSLDPQTLTAFDGQLSVFEYTSGNSNNGVYSGTQTTLPNEGGDFLYDPPLDPSDPHDPFAVVNSYYHIHRMRRFFTDDLKVDMSKPKWALGVVANGLDDNQPMDNAFFSPAGMQSPKKPNLIVIGQGTNTDFAYDSDVFLHEFTHYVASNAIGYSDGQFGTDSYGLSPFAGAIDEGTADYFACTVNGDPILGEASLQPLGAERDLREDGKVCPDDLFGEVHEDGKIIGSAAWAIHELVGKDLGDQIVWGAMSLLENNASLGDFATGAVQVAKSLQGEGKLTDANISDIEKIFAERGLDDCGKVLSLNKSARKSQMFGLSTLAQGFGGGGCKAIKQYGLTLGSLFHYSFAPAEGDKKLRISATLSTFGGKDDLDWGIYIRRNNHVTFSSGFGGLPTLKQFDYKVDGLTTDKGELIIDENSDPPFDPSTTYYVAIVHQNCPMTTLSISGDNGEQIDPGTGGSAGNAGSAGDGGSAAEAGSSGEAGNGGESGAAGSSVIAGSGGATSAPTGRTAIEAVGGGCSAGNAGQSTSGALGLGLAMLGLAFCQRSSSRKGRRLAQR